MTTIASLNNSLPLNSSSQQMDNLATPPRYVFRTDLEIEDMPKPEWLISDILIMDTLSCVYGAPKSFKSFTVLDMALCIATGQPWQGHDVKQGTVAYIAGEGVGGLRKRMKAWKLHHQYVGSAPIFILDEAVPLLNGGSVAELCRALRALPESPALVIIDTLARSMVGGDENQSKDMGRAIEAMDTIRRTFHCHVLIVHHTSKSERGGPRGSNSLTGAMDTEIELKRRNQETSTATLTCANQKDAAHFPDMVLERKVVQIDPLDPSDTSCVMLRGAAKSASTSHAKVVPMTPPVKETRPEKGQREALEVLKSLGIQGASSLRAWEAACKRASKDVSLGSLTTYAKALVENGLVLKVPHTQSGKGDAYLAAQFAASDADEADQLCFEDDFTLDDVA